jgi:hypothetical protein
MSEEPPITKTTSEARQGVRVKGMTTVLAVSILGAVVLLGVMVGLYAFVLKR